MNKAPYAHRSVLGARPREEQELPNPNNVREYCSSVALAEHCPGPDIVRLPLVWTLPTWLGSVQVHQGTAADGSMHAINPGQLAEEMQPTSLYISYSTSHKHENRFCQQHHATTAILASA